MSQLATPAAKPATTRSRKRPQTSSPVASLPSHFVKLDELGNELPADATGHVAVLDRRQNLIVLVASSPKAMTHAKAEAWVETLDVMGHSDWRLPSVDEFFPIADRSRRSPAIDPNFFPGTHSDWYWTSTPSAWSSDYAWIVDFGYGLASDGLPRYDGAFVRAVRSVGAPVGQ
jgi:hypothetical protein